MMVLLLALQAGAAPPPAAALDRYDFAAAPAATVRLPTAVRELSGLAVLADGRWLAHDDEHGRIAARGPVGGDWTLVVQFDGADATGDFEAIAVADGRLWLQRSDGRRRGRLLNAADGRADVVERTTAPCEVESLLAAGSAWWAACKRTGRKGGVLMVTQSRAGGRWREGWRLSGPTLRAAGLPRTVGVADATVDPGTGHWLLVAGPERLLLEVTPDGTLVRAAAVDRRRHPQPEALAVTAEGALLVGDEGTRAGTIAVYRPRVAK